jgi:hypothetical protein
MANLLEETKEALASQKKGPGDVLWIGSKDGTLVIGWPEFEQIANVEYDDDYGGAEVAEDLVVVGDDWWLERGEYDGREWWNYMTKPILKAKNQPFIRVVRSDWESGLKEINKRAKEAAMSREEG